jgi:hypothetical protein
MALVISESIKVHAMKRDTQEKFFNRKQQWFYLQQKSIAGFHTWPWQPSVQVKQVMLTIVLHKD